MAEDVRRPGQPLEPEVIDDRVPEGEARRHLDTARLLARLLDDLFAIPGTSFRIGLDPLIGLVPGAGDLVGAILSTWLLVVASRTGAPASVLARMALNVGLDVVVGAVPFAGDLFDAGWKANARNVRLLEAWMAKPGPTRRASLGLVAGLVVAVLVTVIAVLYAVVSVVAWAIGAVRGGPGAGG